MQIRAKLMQAHYLFLGYTLADWRLRVFVQRIWNGPRLGSAKRWAVATDPSDLDDQLWQGPAPISIAAVSSTASRDCSGFSTAVRADASSP